MSSKKCISIHTKNKVYVPGDPFSVVIGNIAISNSRSGKKEHVHITTGRADSLEGGDFEVSELEVAIQEFFDKNF